VTFGKNKILKIKLKNSNLMNDIFGPGTHSPLTTNVTTSATHTQLMQKIFGPGSIIHNPVTTTISEITTAISNMNTKYAPNPTIFREMFGSDITVTTTMTPSTTVTSTVNSTNNILPSALFQEEPVEIPPIALEIWRDARGHLSSEARCTARANYITYLADNNVLPKWSVGLEPLPGFLQNHDETVQQLVELRHMQGLEVLRSASQALQGQSQHHRQVGNVYRHSLRVAYGENDAGLQEANSKLNSLVTRDRDACRNTLTRRAETLNQYPLTDEKLKEAMLAPLPNARTGRARSRSPTNPTRGRGRGRGLSQTQNGRNNNSRGSGRGRGRGRGSTSYRGRTANRTPSTTGLYPGPSNDNLTAEERALISNLRNQRNGQQN
jgi:hypothetical protein